VPPLALPEAPPGASSCRVELEQLIQCHFAFIWRLLRRLGLPPSDADDAAQQVFLTAGAKLASIRPGSERAFLYGCALNLANKWQRARARARRSVSLEAELPQELSSDGISPEDRLDRTRARELLDALLEAMPTSLRTVFVLFELEQLSSLQIAELLELPRGTVASRLRRAREDFEKRVQRLEARRALRGAQ
jgi:RNA polymerase sigma-70 factor (ECF subfamily)